MLFRLIVIVCVLPFLLFSCIEAEVEEKVCPSINCEKTTVGVEPGAEEEVEPFDHLNNSENQDIKYLENQQAKMVVFGDSLSDPSASLGSWEEIYKAYPELGPYLFSENPELKKILNEKSLPAPYQGARFSNGLLAVERLNDLLYQTNDLASGWNYPYYFESTGLFEAKISHRVSQLGNNYSMAGATAAASGVNSITISASEGSGVNKTSNVLIDLHEQLAAYLGHHGKASPEYLYVIMIGANDLIAASALTEQMDRKKVAREAARAIRSTIEKLYEEGARQILVVNSPDIGKLPLFKRDDASTEADLRNAMTSLSEYFNGKLNYYMSMIDFDEEDMPNIYRYDLFNRLNDFINDKSAQNWNTTDACTDMDALLDPLSYKHEINYVNACDDNAINEFVFIDQIHPSAATHEYFANDMICALQEQAYPAALGLGDLSTTCEDYSIDFSEADSL